MTGLLFPKPIRPRRPKLRTQPRVAPELRARVLLRDRVCLGVVAGHEHVCRGADGLPHGYRETTKLSVEHVHLDGSGFGRPRANSDEDHCFALCYGLNVGGVPKVIREWIRKDYVPFLARLRR